MIIRGFTFESTPPNRRHLLAAWLQYLPYRATVRVVWQPDEPWDDFFVRCIWVGSYADVLATFCDSSLIGAKDKNGTPLMPLAAYQGRAKAVAQLKAHIPSGFTVELLNEGGGDWLGPDEEVIEKTLAARDILDAAGVQTAATFYLDGSDMERMFVFARAAADAGLVVDWALVSWYPNWTPGVTPGWTEVFSRLGTIFPNAGSLGFGEFGPEPKKMTPAQRIALIRSIQGIRGVTPRFAMGGFYWDAATETLPVLAALAETLQ